MKYWRSIILVVAVFSAAFARNHLSGVLTVSDLPAKTYHVIGNLDVPAGKTLTIQPGAKFVFEGFYEFRVKGTLKANGQPGREILFGDDSSLPWMGITLHNQHASEISHSIIRNASAGIHLNGASVSIHHCRFFDNKTAVHCWNGAEPLIYNNDFIDNKDAINNYDSKPYIYNNLFAYNEKWGIWGIQSEGAVYSHNAFWQNGEGKRAVFVDRKWLPVSTFKEWQELEKDPKFYNASRMELRTETPLLRAGKRELSNGRLWNISFEYDPSIGSENIHLSMAKKKAAAPAQFMTALNQNKPNPFNPVTKISYTVGGEKVSPVEISAYNARGRMVRKLVSKNMKPGQYSVQWNARDRNGKPVSGGTYFYKMVMPGHVLIRRMTLLK